MHLVFVFSEFFGLYTSAISIHFILSFLGPEGLSASKLLQLHLELGSMHHTRDQ